MRETIRELEGRLEKIKGELEGAREGEGRMSGLDKELLKERGGAVRFWRLRRS